MHARVLVVILCMSAVPVSASLIEEATGGAVSYQFDGHTDQDAPDSCEKATSELALQLNNSTHGYLLPEEDEADYFTLEIGTEVVGTRVTIQVAESDTEMGVALDVHVPECQASVLDEGQQPAAPPEHPEPAPGEQQAGLSNLEQSWDCGSEWFFVINQVGNGIAPESIHVVWTDGTQADIPLAKATPATVAHYRTTENLGVTIHSASAILPDSWDGRFNIGTGSCDAVDGGAVFGEPATVSSDGQTISFTPTQSGTYVVGVLLNFVAPDPAAAASDLLAPKPMTCHACVDETEEPFQPLMYSLSGSEGQHAA